MAINNMPLRVVVLDGGYDNYDTERRVLAEVGAALELAAGVGTVDGADALLVRESPVTAAMMDRMPACRAIVRYGIGVDNIDRDAARDRKIYVANVPDYGTEEVSDQALALVMAVARRVVTRDREVRDGAWNIGPAQKVYRMAGKKLGLIGYGRIAQAFERKMRGVGIARVMVFDPYATLPPGVEAASVESICQQADVISLHAPLTPQTRHILNAEGIGLLKPTAIVVNTSRGPLIEEAALVRALTEGRIFGAGLDVFEEEPFGTANPLRFLTNAVLSDHCGWYSEESVQDLQRKAAEEIVRIFRGETPLNWLNRWER
jgi:D-3-phosphoglycerate dehydrogenase